MIYRINWNGTDGVFAVPDSVVDSIKLANGKSVKVLLYILKTKITDIDFSAVASAVGVTEEDVEDAISFWKQIGIVYLDGTAPAETPKRTPVVSADKSTEISVERSKEKSSRMLSPAEIAERVEKNELIKYLFDSAETTLGRLLTHTDQRTLIWLTEYYGFEPDILIMIMDFAANQNKKSIPIG